MIGLLQSKAADIFDDYIEFSKFLYVHLLVRLAEIEAVNKRLGEIETVDKRLAEIEKEKRRQEEIQARRGDK